MELDAQDVRLKTAAFALGAADIKIAQELHLDLFKTGAAATLATAGSEMNENALAVSPCAIASGCAAKARDCDRESKVKESASSAVCGRASA